VFYGQAYDSRYTDVNVYRLVPGGGRVVAPWPAPAALSPSPTRYTETLHLERQNHLRNDLFQDPADDLWLWDHLISGIRNRFTARFDLPNVITSAPGRVVVGVKGASQSAQNGMHGARIEVNGMTVSQFQFLGLEGVVVTADVPQGVWLAISNAIAVVTEPPPGVQFDRFYLDYIRVIHERAMVAVSNQVLAEVEAGAVQAAGFTNNAIEVWDVSDAWNPRRLTDAGVSGGPGAWSAHFTASSAGRYLVTTIFRSPAGWAPWSTLPLRDHGWQADHVIIAADSMLAEAEALASSRRARGLDSVVIPMQSIYDVFNHGIRDARAVPAFLSYAWHHWKKPPRYVALAGTHSLDYRNQLSPGQSLVPTPPAGSPTGVYVSDHDVGDVNGDGRLDIAVGRIPVQTGQQLLQYVAKLEAFEQSGVWRDTVMIATDNRADGLVYLETGDELAAIVGPERLIERADVDTLGIHVVRDMVTNALQQGREMILYVGHGNSGQLAEEGILNAYDIPSFTNRSTPGVVGLFGCLMGNFGIAGNAAIGESLIREAGGASAVIGSSSLINFEHSGWFSRTLASNIYTLSIARLGDAWLESKNTHAGTDSERGIRTFQLLGDPSLAVGPAGSPRGGVLPPPSRPPYATWLRWAYPPSWMEIGRVFSPGDDDDGDTMNNMEEYVAGTDQLDPQSALVLVEVVRKAGGGVELAWPSAPGRLYRIEQALALGGPYELVAEHIPAEPPTNRWLVDPATPDAAAYRVWVY